MNAGNSKKSIVNERILTVIVFSLFCAWLISFPYEGQILYALTARWIIDPYSMVLGAIVMQIVGLFSCGFFIKNIQGAKKLMLFDTMVCIAGSCLFFFTPSAIWTIALFIISFFAGTWIGAWGYYFKYCSSKNGHMATIAGSLACSTFIMIPLNMFAIHISPYLGLGIAILMLIIALFFMLRLPEQNGKEALQLSCLAEDSPNITKPLAFLCLFIIIITINSGLMFQVVNPAFMHLQNFTSWYWAVPYIAAIVIVARLPKTVNQSYILYAAISMIGLSFIAFFALDRSVISYFIINTLLLGACGINDLFWWSILGEMLDFHKNPARILGIGLSANVLGVLLGELIASLVAPSGGDSAPSLIGLTVVCVALVILPVLHKYLSAVLKNQAFLTDLKEMPPAEQSFMANSFAKTGGLTERESQITGLLMKGYTYRLIAQELFLSESTIKTHIQHIYCKLNVRNKTELIQKLIK